MDESTTGCDVQAAPGMPRPMGDLRTTRAALNQPIQAQREIRIMGALNGFVVIVGCQTVVFETREKKLAELDRYLKNPVQVEKEYVEKK